MKQAQAGDTVRIHYSGTLNDGTQFDTSEGSDPLEFAVGSGMVIAGFDKAVEGMAVGESKSVKIPPEEAYGPRHEQLVQEVPKSALPDDIAPAVGMQLQGKSADGQVDHSKRSAGTAARGRLTLAPIVGRARMMPASPRTNRIRLAGRFLLP